MKKYTLKQLQDAMVELYKRTDEDGEFAYRMAFEEILLRMGDEAFDAWYEKYVI